MLRCCNKAKDINNGEYSNEILLFSAYALQCLVNYLKLKKHIDIRRIVNGICKL